MNVAIHGLKVFLSILYFKMSHLGLFAIFGLIDYDSSLKIRNEQQELTKITNNKQAFIFPIHITLKGRFIAKEVTILNQFSSFYFSKKEITFDILLGNPYYNKPELVWRELFSSNKGYQEILTLHKFFEEQIQPNVIKDEVPESHKYLLGFRPHVTLGWGVTSEYWKIFSDLSFEPFYECKIIDIILVRYPNEWRKGKKIDVLSKISINV